ncbi:hypothetical protein KAV79_02040 [Candidatus Aerophobetes bacterium]|nr:hypothetical protein [Candidatus Aerophobetes bacterium]
MIAVIDYGMGNLRSVEKALQKVGGKALITSNPKKILDASGAVLPGVGASGGAGTLEHLYDVFIWAGADAALAASIFHYKEYSIREVKSYLKKRGINVRI